MYFCGDAYRALRVRKGYPVHSCPQKDASLTVANLFFFFQAEDGIRDLTVTGVQTCALPIFNPSVVLAAATSAGKDLAPRLAIHLGTAVASECTHLELENGKLVATRPAYAGKVLLRVKVNSSPSIATLRPNVFTAKEVVPVKKPTIEQIQFNRPDSQMIVKEFVTQGAKKVDLTEASVIVSGGRGMGGPQN